MARAGVGAAKYNKEQRLDGRQKDARFDVDSEPRGKTPSQPRASTTGARAALRGKIRVRSADRNEEGLGLGKRLSLVTVAGFAFGGSNAAAAIDRHQ